MGWMLLPALGLWLLGWLAGCATARVRMADGAEVHLTTLGHATAAYCQPAGQATSHLQGTKADTEDELFDTVGPCVAVASGSLSTNLQAGFAALLTAAVTVLAHFAF